MADAEKSRPAGHTITIKRSRAAPDSPHLKALKAYSEKKQFDDPFTNFYGAVGGQTETILQPPYNMTSLQRLPKENNTLKACIDAMVVNTVGHGYALTYIGPDGEEKSTASVAEAEELNGFLKFPNEDMSMIEALSNVKTDKETTGMGYLEIARDEDGRVALVTHIPSFSVRRTLRDTELTPYEVQLPRGGKMVTLKLRKRFCRYVQRVGGAIIYFKEFGDPRKIDPKTGKVNDALTVDQVASEILADGYYNAGDAYGLPCWIGQMPSILGSRESELANLDFFKENTIPALAVLVSGGSVTQASIDQLEQTLTAARGRASLNRSVVIEAESDPKAASADGALPAPRVDIKPLVGERQNEGLFLEYDRDCRDKIRNAFRLPPVFVGMTGDYTFASAKVSFEVAESQIFGPERRLTDDMINNKILSTFKPKFWAFRLQPPRISDPEEVTNALAVFDSMGALTPNTAIQMANEYFDLNIPKIKDAWGNWPFAIVQAYANAGRLKGVEEIAEADMSVQDPGGEPNNGANSQDPQQHNQPNAKEWRVLRSELTNLRKAIRKFDEVRVKKAA